MVLVPLSIVATMKKPTRSPRRPPTKLRDVTVERLGVRGRIRLVRWMRLATTQAHQVHPRFRRRHRVLKILVSRTAHRSNSGRAKLTAIQGAPRVSSQDLASFTIYGARGARFRN